MRGWGSGLGGFGVRVQDLRFRVQGSWFRIQGSRFRVQGSGFRIQDSGFRVQGSGFRVQGMPEGVGLGAASGRVVPAVVECASSGAVRRVQARSRSRHARLLLHGLPRMVILRLGETENGGRGDGGNPIALGRGRVVGRKECVAVAQLGRGAVPSMSRWVARVGILRCHRAGQRGVVRRCRWGDDSLLPCVHRRRRKVQCGGGCGRRTMSGSGAGRRGGCGDAGQDVMAAGGVVVDGLAALWAEEVVAVAAEGVSAIILT